MFALVFVLIHAESDGANQIQRESVMVSDLLGTAMILYVGLEYSVQDIVIRQSV